MTDYIEELMRTAGVEKYQDYRQYNFAQIPYGKEELKKSKDKGIECIRIRNFQENNDCIYWTELHFPTFTPKKQLEIIKIAKLYICEDEICCNLVIDTDFMDNPSECTYWEYTIPYDDKDKPFPQALAQLTTELMNAGKLDKGKVKEILNG